MLRLSIRRNVSALPFSSSTAAMRRASIFNTSTNKNILPRQQNFVLSAASLPSCYSNVRWCSTSENEESKNQQQQQQQAPLTPEQRAAFTAPPTIVTSKNFDQIVMQSQLAMVLTYHVDNTRCRQYLSRMEESVNEMNIRVRHRWLNMMTVDADRNPTLAGAFSIERVKLPITFFVFSGTIIDKVNGAVPKERLASILMRFMEYYQEQKGVELEDHGFVHGAKVETLTEGASTQEYEGKLEWMLTSKERVWSNPKEAQALVEKALEQSQKDLRQLQDEVGLNVKKIDPSELFASYYSKPSYIAAARIAFFKSLVQVIDPSVPLNDVVKNVKDTINQFKHGMARPAVRAVACAAQLRLAERQARELLLKNDASAFSSAKNGGAELDENLSKSLKSFEAWVDRIDTPGGLDGEFPQATMDELLTSYRQSTISVRKITKKMKEENSSGNNSNIDPQKVIEDAKLIQLLIGDCIRATLQLFPDDQRCNMARSRFAAMMH